MLTKKNLQKTLSLLKIIISTTPARATILLKTLISTTPSRATILLRTLIKNSYFSDSCKSHHLIKNIYFNGSCKSHYLLILNKKVCLKETMNALKQLKLLMVFNAVHKHDRDYDLH